VVFVPVTVARPFVPEVQLAARDAAHDGRRPVLGQHVRECGRGVLEPQIAELAAHLEQEYNL